MSVAGVWENEYGSRMALSVDGDRVRGSYTSTTGSTGRYHVVGHQAAAGPGAAAGRPVCLAIAWHSVAPGEGDASWHWVSGLSGQLSGTGDAERLVLAHALVATSDFPGLTPAGTFLDKLTYTRVPDAPVPAPPPADAGPPAADPLTGDWTSGDGTALLIAAVTACGQVAGTLVWRGARTPLHGVTDRAATAAGLSQQAVALTALPAAPDGPAIAFAGTLDRAAGTLTLLGLASTATPSTATYVQTASWTRVFHRDRAA